MAPRRKLQGHVEVLFSEGWHVPRPSGPRRGFRPNLDSFHTDDPHELTVVIELSGVEPSSIAVAVSERLLVIAGTRSRGRASGRVYQQMEIEYGPFERSVLLAEDVDPTAARARYEHGMVTISLPVATRKPAGGRHTIVVERP